MSDDKKVRNGHLALIVTLVSLVVGVLVIGSYVVAIAGDNADTKRRVTNIEQRVAEDRVEVKRDVREVKQDVKDVKNDMQTILRKLDQIEAGQKAAERRAR
jgi:hypothetical protein